MDKKVPLHTKSALKKSSTVLARVLNGHCAAGICYNINARLGLAFLHSAPLHSDSTLSGNAHRTNLRRRPRPQLLPLPARSLDNSLPTSLGSEIMESFKIKTPFLSPRHRSSFFLPASNPLCQRVIQLLGWSG